MNVFRKFGVVAGSFILTAAILTAVFLLVVRPAQRNWGATGAEVARVMPGDDLVPHAPFQFTRAVTIKANPDRIWPWLVQIGYQRGGLYSYDWIDRLIGVLDRPSADRVLPEFQGLKAGDQLPMGLGPGWPVAALDPGRSMLLDIRAPETHITWFLALYPLNEGATRLVLRVRGDMPLKPVMAPALPLLYVGEFAMVRKMLIGIKQRVEGAPPTPTDELFELLLWTVAVLVGFIALLMAFFRRKWRRFFLLAWASFLAVCFLAMVQPPLWTGIVLDFVLILFLFASLRGHKTSII